MEFYFQTNNEQNNKVDFFRQFIQGLKGLRRLKVIK